MTKKWKIAIVFILFFLIYFLFFSVDNMKAKSQSGLWTALMIDRVDAPYTCFDGYLFYYGDDFVPEVQITRTIEGERVQLTSEVSTCDLNWREKLSARVFTGECFTWMAEGNRYEDVSLEIQWYVDGKLQTETITFS